jgi:hypothetical protein
MTIGRKRLFHVHMKEKIRSDVIAGTMHGITMLTRSRNDEHPSILAASMIARSTFSMKLRMIRTPKGRRRAVWGMITDQYVFKRW